MAFCKINSQYFSIWGKSSKRHQMNQLLETYTWSRQATSKWASTHSSTALTLTNKQSTLNPDGIFKSSHNHLLDGDLSSDQKGCLKAGSRK